jgi:magnesium-transporting ATPase (P-type)
MFYKNILFVLPQFWFGFFNTFSGQTIYEDMLYQMYNVVFTACPIAVFAVLDWQHTKDEFCDKPLLYLIGLRNSCFTPSLFKVEMLQAVVNGLVVLLTVFFSISDFWIAACLVYFVIVVVANLKIAQKMNNHTWISTFFFGFSILMFLLQFLIESKVASVSNANIYKTFSRFFSTPQVWYVVILLSWVNFMQYMILGQVTAYNRSTERQERLQTLKEHFISS